MDELDFGWGFGAMLMSVAFLYALAKGLLLLLICYFPAQYFYVRFLKGGEVCENFFKAFFSWSIFSFLFMMLAQLASIWIHVEFFDDFLRQYNSGFHFGNLLFYQFIFWKYSFDRNAKKLSVIRELSFKNKLLNFVLVFSTLIILGFMIRLENSHYILNWLIRSILFFTILLLFIGVRNLKIINPILTNK